MWSLFGFEYLNKYDFQLQLSVAIWLSFDENLTIEGSINWKRFVTLVSWDYDKLRCTKILTGCVEMLREKKWFEIIGTSRSEVMFMFQF